MQRAHPLCDLVVRDERLCLIHCNHCFPLCLHHSACRQHCSCCREAVRQQGRPPPAFHTQSFWESIVYRWLASGCRLWDGPCLCEFAFEAYEVDLGGVSPEVGGDVEIYAVHPAELRNPAHAHLNITQSLPALQSIAPAPDTRQCIKTRQIVLRAGAVITVDTYCVGYSICPLRFS